MKNLKKTLALAALVLSTVGAMAQTAGKLTWRFPKFSDSSIILALSDNGRYALVTGASYEYVGNSNCRLLDVENNKYTIIAKAGETQAQALGKYSVADVTDDGNIVVGLFDGSTLSEDNSSDFVGTGGFWNASTQTWTALPIPSGSSYVEPKAVTPDGHYAVGVSYQTSGAWKGVMWDLTTNTIVTLNEPAMSHDPSDVYEQYSTISADGRYVIFYGNQTVEPMAYLLDRQTGTSVRLGKGGTNAPDDFLQLEPDGFYFSANSKYVACTMRTTNDNVYPLLYNIQTGEYTCYNSTADDDMMVAAVDNDGHIIGCNPTSTPTREWHVYYDGVQYDASLIFSQRYGVDFTTLTGFESTGSVVGLSSDGKTVASFSYPFGESYVVVFPESLSEACENIDLLNSYTATPADGASFTWMETVELLFTQDITVTGTSTAAALYDKTGKLVRNSIGFSVDPLNSKNLLVTFRATKMNDGEQYTVKIPAGTVSLANNSRRTNQDITLTYRGRGEKPVEAVKAFPADGAELARLDNSSNFVTLTYDTKVAVTDSASATLVQVTDGEEKTVATLNVAASDTLIGIYPSATQYLYSGSTYKVVLKKGSVTDLSGYASSANEEYVLNYIGTYERQLSTDDATLFTDSFNNTSQSLATWMRYEGDHNTPTSEMQNWTFDTDNTPWNFTLRDGASSNDNFAGSHSMYSPAGQSDDWMVIPQLNIPDAYCTLVFDAQSYMDDKTDQLKVVIWACDQNINSLSAETIAKMKSEGNITTFTLNFGETQDYTEGEWTNYTVDLSQYAGKNVYIGFWNNNTDQSAVFVDNVVVKRNLKYLLSLTNPASVVNKSEQTIAGTLTGNSDTDNFSTVTLTLKDAAGNTVDTFTKSGLSLTKGVKQEFSFTKALPLTVGETTPFTIGVQLDSYTDNVKSTIKDLAFEPVKRVVLEEYTGITCVNCPMGILAIENLEKLYGDQFIPVSIHTFTGDAYGSGLSGYSTYLGLSAAPTAQVQRGGYAASPMVQDDEGYYTFSNGENAWLDLVAAALNVPADLDFSVTGSEVDTVNNTLSVDLTVKAALNLKNQYLNVFVVGMEDGLISNQTNNLYNRDDDIFGEWGKGGKYGMANVPNVTNNDVVRCYYGSFTGSNVGYPQTLKAGEETTVTVDLDYPEQIVDRTNGKLLFMLFDGNSGELINSVVAKLPDLDPTGIAELPAQTSSSVVARYTIDGRQINTPQPGINIIRYADGHTEKVVVK